MCAPTLPLALSEELNAAAQVPMDAFLLQLLPLRPFAEVVLQQDLREFSACPQLALFLPTYFSRFGECVAISICSGNVNEPKSIPYSNISSKGYWALLRRIE